MHRREFLKVFTTVGTTAILSPTSLFYIDEAKHRSKLFIAYSSAKINHMNEYAMGAIAPSLTTYAIYACTAELIYIILFLFLLLTSGLIISMDFFLY